MRYVRLCLEDLAPRLVMACEVMSQGLRPQGYACGTWGYVQIIVTVVTDLTKWPTTNSKWLTQHTLYLTAPPLDLEPDVRPYV